MALLTAVTMPASSVKNPIKVNQVGYLTHESKIATIEPEAKSKSFLIRDQKGKTVWRTKHATTKKSPFSSKIRQEIDFLLYHQAWQIYPGSRKASTKLHHFQRFLYGSLESIHQRLLLSAFWGELGKKVCWRVRTPGSSPGHSCHGASFGSKP